MKNKERAKRWNEITEIGKEITGKGDKKRKEGREKEKKENKEWKEQKRDEKTRKMEGRTK